jgi:starch-binding outer membrane protein, SusD/RagB family
MKKILIFIILGFTVFGCELDEEFLTRQPTNLMLEEQVWKDVRVVNGILLDIIDRTPFFTNEGNGSWQPEQVFELNEAFPSDEGYYGWVRNSSFSYSKWDLWNYDLIREINLFIEKAEEADKLVQSDRDNLIASGRFVRAMAYFQLVKRMGGVPLWTESKLYDYSGDPSYLAQPRAKEHEVYDFIISEMDAIKDVLPVDGSEKSYITNGAALALQCRAALYAGSIAKYGVNTPLVTLPGDIVGIPSGMANGYYTKALSAATELIGKATYSLYTKKMDLGAEENFFNMMVDKDGNTEAIWVEDYTAGFSKRSDWVLRNQPWSLREDLEGGRVNPSLNLAQTFEKLDNTWGVFENKDAGGNYIYYDNIGDIYANRDARLGGSLILPGSKFKNKNVDIWAGTYIEADGSIVSGDTYGQAKLLPGATAEVKVVGEDGPIDNLRYTAQSGFYVRKNMDPTLSSGSRGVGGSSWNVWFRYGEVLLNAAEAEFELGNAGNAAAYLNQVRQRAGFTVDLVAGDVTFDRIFNERRAELCFEGHYLWDCKRWRIAHVIWDGSNSGLTNNPGVATEHSNRPWGLWPYKVYDPGGPNDGKWIFEEKLPSACTADDFFRMGNYYSEIDDDVISSNSLLVRNPNQE